MNVIVGGTRLFVWHPLSAGRSKYYALILSQIDFDDCIVHSLLLSVACACVQANREAPTLVFTSARGEVGRISTTQAIVAQHTPETALEEEVAALLEKAGAASAKAVQEAEEKLALKVNLSFSAVNEQSSETRI
jgi:hypothetical protein